MHVQGNDLRRPRHCTSLNLVIAIMSVISYPALHALCFIVIFCYLAYLHVYSVIVIRCDNLQMVYCVSVVCSRLCQCMYAHVHMDICRKLATDSNVNVVHVLSTASQ